jgi:preprotein translocase subunit SecG
MDLLFISVLLQLVGFIFFILSIILFFKIWGMTNDVAEIRKMMEADRRKRAKAAEEVEGASEHKDDVGVEVKKGYKSVVQSEDNGISRVVKMFIIILMLLFIVNTIIHSISSHYQ